MPRKPTVPKRPAINPRCIDVTSEYDVFKRLPGNRAVSETHVRNLMDAMREHDLFTPILVNQDFAVIDGQHRLEARKRLGFPVPYYWEEHLTLKDVQGLNSTQKSWKNQDFADAYIELGFESYKTYKWFRSKYGLPHKAACCLLEGGPSHGVSERFRNGTFTVRDLEGGKRKAEMLGEIREHFPKNWKHDAFIAAFLIVLGRDGFEFKTLMHRIKLNPMLMRPCRTQDQYLQMIEEVYNYRSPKKVPLRFGVDKQPERSAML